MNNRWIVIDCSFLCWRIYYTGLRDLSHHEVPTGVMFGFMRDVVNLQEQLDTQNIAFCFDSKDLLRKQVCPTYKQRRRQQREEASPEETAAFESMVQQIDTLRDDFLPSCGFKNIFHKDGYEADDLIASVCRYAPDTAEIIIVSSDKDLYQLLDGDRVMMWDIGKKTYYTESHLLHEFGVNPDQWVIVKCIAGCNTDDVPGVVGVGEKTAVKYIKGELKETAKAVQKIRSRANMVKANRAIVKLPFKGTPKCRLHHYEINEEIWQENLAKYGMKSLRNSPPKLKRKGFHNE